VQAGAGAGERASLPSPSKTSLSLASVALAGRLPTYTDCRARSGRETRARALWDRQAEGRARGRTPRSARLPSESLRGAGRPGQPSTAGAGRRTAAQARPTAAARACLAGRGAGRALTASGAACAACACCTSAWRGSAYETVSVRPFILRRSEAGFKKSYGGMFLSANFMCHGQLRQPGAAQRARGAEPCKHVQRLLHQAARTHGCADAPRTVSDRLAGRVPRQESGWRRAAGARLYEGALRTPLAAFAQVWL